MVKIIKPGSNEKIRGTKTFYCKNCGCIFKADKEDYHSASHYNDFYFVCPCPYCNSDYAYEQE